MLIKQRFEEALAKKNNDIKRFIWKGPKYLTESGKRRQDVKKLVDCSVEELKEYYKYCNVMLNNTEPSKLGRIFVLDIVTAQKLKCSVELFLRWLNKEHNITRYAFGNIITTFFNNNTNLDRSELTLQNIMNNCPFEYSDLPVQMVLDGCLDKLGVFNRKYLTNTFIFRQGVCPSDKERKDADGRITLEYVIEYLELENKNHKKLKFRNNGLTLEQMKAILSIRYKKYSDLSNMQLEVLRNRILPLLEDSVRIQMKQWDRRKEQIEAVLKYKGVDA